MCIYFLVYFNRVYLLNVTLTYKTSPKLYVGNLTINFKVRNVSYGPKKVLFFKKE